MIGEYLAKQAEVEKAKAPGEVLLSLSGSWEDDRPAEEIVAEIRATRRNSRRDLWL